MRTFRAFRTIFGLPSVRLVPCLSDGNREDRELADGGGLKEREGCEGAHKTEVNDLFFLQYNIDTHETHGCIWPKLSRSEAYTFADS